MREKQAVYSFLICICTKLVIVALMKLGFNLINKYLLQAEVPTPGKRSIEDTSTLPNSKNHFYILFIFLPKVYSMIFVGY